MKSNIILKEKRECKTKNIRVFEFWVKEYGIGGLISFAFNGQDKLFVRLYRLDEGVEVFVEKEREKKL